MRWSPRYEREWPTMIDIRMAPAAAAKDTTLVDELAALVNSVYAVAEEGLWRTARPARRRRGWLN